MEGKKIKINKTAKGVEISIDHSIKKKELNIITLWLALWSVSGVIILVNLFMPYPKETRLLMVVFLTFWAYFEATVYNAYVWKKKGIEILTLKDGAMEIRSNGRKESLLTVDLTKIDELILAPENKFREAMTNSFWNIGEPAVFIKTKERSIGFGRQLSREEATRIEKAVRPFLKKVVV